MNTMVHVPRTDRHIWMDAAFRHTFVNVTFQIVLYFTPNSLTQCSVGSLTLLLLL